MGGGGGGDYSNWPVLKERKKRVSIKITDKNLKIYILYEVMGWHENDTFFQTQEITLHAYYLMKVKQIDNKNAF